MRKKDKAVATDFPLFQRNQLLLAQEKSKYYSLPRLRTEKSKYYTYNSRHAAPLVAIAELAWQPRKDKLVLRERQGHQSRCHGLSTFLAEIVVFDIGKVEISQYYLTRLRTEKSKYYKSNSRHAGPSQPDCERKSRNITNLTHDDCERKSRNFTNIIHGMPGPRCPLMNGKVEISHM